MHPFTRRRLVCSGVSGVAGWWLSGCSDPSGDATGSTSDDPSGDSSDGSTSSGETAGSADTTTTTGEPWDVPGCDPDGIVDSLLTEPTDAFVPLAQWLVAGVAIDVLWTAALTVGARTVVTEIDMHSALVVNAARLLSARLGADDVLVPLFYAWHRVHRAALDLAGQPLPALGELDPATIPAAGDAEAALLAACDAWDADAAEAAIVGLHAGGGRDAVLGPLTRLAQRNHNWVGHTAIWVAYAIRGLDAFGWDCAPWVLRSLARAINAHPEDASTSAYEANLSRLATVPATWRDGADDPAEVPALLEVFRVGDAQTCVGAVIERLEAGLGPRTIWTALGITAVEQSLRWQELSAGVHELDTLNALRHLAQLTTDPDTELLALLQAAAWRPEFRVFIDDLAPVIDEGLDALQPAAGPTPDLPAIFAALAGDRIEAARMLVAYFADGGTAEAVIAAWPTIVVTYAAFDEHHYKFHVALLEETEAALPEWRTTLLLGITLRGPSSLDPHWERYDEAQAIIGDLP